MNGVVLPERTVRLAMPPLCRVFHFPLLTL